jgi:hypothetical protein
MFATGRRMIWRAPLLAATAVGVALQPEFPKGPGALWMDRS